MNVLLSFLTGATITLAVQLVLQFWVVPQVETRKRREDRWERNVVDLGELLTTLVRPGQHFVDQAVKVLAAASTGARL